MHYARVGFASYTSRQVLRAGGVRRLVLGAPRRASIGRVAVERLIGESLRAERRAG